MFVGAREIEKISEETSANFLYKMAPNRGEYFFKEMPNLARGTIKIIIWNKACIYNTFPAQLANLIHFTYC